MHYHRCFSVSEITVAAAGSRGVRSGSNPAGRANSRSSVRGAIGSPNHINPDSLAAALKKTPGRRKKYKQND